MNAMTEKKLKITT